MVPIYPPRTPLKGPIIWVLGPLGDCIGKNGGQNAQGGSLNAGFVQHVMVLAAGAAGSSKFTAV